MNATDISPSSGPDEATPTAEEPIASIIPLRKLKKAKTGAERNRAYRQRKQQKATALAETGSPPRRNTWHKRAAFLNKR